MIEHRQSRPGVGAQPPRTARSRLTNLLRLTTVVPLAALILLTGCARTGPDSPGPDATGPDTAVPGRSPGPPQPGEAPVLQIRSIGGFVPAITNITRVPLVSVYLNGQVITEGPQIEIFPAPALPNIRVDQISPATVDALVAEAVLAGVRAGVDLGNPSVADAPSTRFTVVTGTGTQTVDAPALSLPTSDLPGLTAAQRAARDKLVRFQNKLTDLSAAGSQAYVPITLAAVVMPHVSATEPGLSAQPAVPWPGPTLPGAPLGNGLKLSCVAVSGGDLAPVLAAARQANAATAWRSGGKQWAVTFRPLLPEERGCDGLAGTR